MKPQLLVVDDNEANRDMLSQRLIRKGYGVETAENGPDALALIEVGNFDLILLDIMMPGMSGIEVLRTLREKYSTRDLPIIMASQLQSAPLVAKDIVITRPLPGVRMGAGYLSLTNATSQRILITKVTSPNFASIEMHESVLEDGISRMVKLDEVAIRPSRTVRFEPGGKHLMLRNPVDTIDAVTLQFYNGDALLLSIVTTPED